MCACHAIGKVQFLRDTMRARAHDAQAVDSPTDIVPRALSWYTHRRFEALRTHVMVKRARPGASSDYDGDLAPPVYTDADDDVLEGSGATVASSSASYFNLQSDVAIAQLPNCVARGGASGLLHLARGHLRRR